MKRFKRMAAALLAVVAVLMLLPGRAWAAGPIDLNRAVSLTVSCLDGDTPLVDAQFELYLVATSDEFGALTPVDSFGQFNVGIQGENDEAWRTLASTMEGYVLRDQLPPDGSGKTNADGLVSFPGGERPLTPGLYLVLGHRHTQDGKYYDPSPFLVMLPGLDGEENVWVYDVTANPKFDSRPVPAEPGTITRKVLKVWKDEGYENRRPQEIIVQLLCDGKVFDTVTLNGENDWRYAWTDLDERNQWTVVERELEDYSVEVTQEGITFLVTNTYKGSGTPETPGKPSEPELPYTGQLWWPVPVLFAAGLLLVVAGLLRRRGARHEG